jgi:hypothetical protein
VANGVLPIGLGQTIIGKVIDDELIDVTQLQALLRGASNRHYDQGDVRVRRLDWLNPIVTANRRTTRIMEQWSAVVKSCSGRHLESCRLLTVSVTEELDVLRVDSLSRVTRMF